MPSLTELIKMSDVIDSLIVVLAPLIIAAYLLAAGLIFRRKLALGENGIYTAIVTILLISAISWALLEWTYVRNLLGLIQSPADILSARFFRLGIAAASLYNLYQFWRGMRDA